MDWDVRDVKVDQSVHCIVRAVFASQPSSVVAIRQRIMSLKDRPGLSLQDAGMVVTDRMLSRKITRL
jgi:hypothetical protein